MRDFLARSLNATGTLLLVNGVCILLLHRSLLDDEPRHSGLPFIFLGVMVLLLALVTYPRDSTQPKRRKP